MVLWIPEADRLSSSCVLEQPNARLHLLPEAAARDERRLAAVRCKPLLGAGVGRASRLDAPLVSPHDHTPERAMTPVVRTHAGQRRLPGLAELGVRFRLARLVPRPHAYLVQLGKNTSRV